MKKLPIYFLLEFFLDHVYFTILLYHEGIISFPEDSEMPEKVFTIDNKLIIKRLRRAKIVSTLIKAMPFVRCVLLNGSLAQGKSSYSSDIDLLIICKNSRIFTARFFSILAVWITGLKRSPNEAMEHSGMFCLNYFMTEDNLVIPHDREKSMNKYCAINYSNSLFMCGEAKIFIKFIENNIVWMQNYLSSCELEKLVARLNIAKSKNKNFKDSRPRFIEKLLSGKAGDRLEQNLKNLQVRRIKQDPRTQKYPQLIVVNDKELRFHPPKNNSQLIVK